MVGANTTDRIINFIGTRWKFYISIPVLTGNKYLCFRILQ
ncbi:hypothetical protein PRABACTJOHN_01340 [Parabacteroides johnsonii DSM 18315]|uniref:Uncharacterized protein n=1 Tax=Parabacteroides johnsonii DSM 18315 TaxID=537006 RepID=B7B8I9_9BACT|nr:hypothetical protein PRABACTJOHN_01340 [Parabacteroides johnsonii DSM 18315]